MSEQQEQLVTPDMVDERYADPYGVGEDYTPSYQGERPGEHHWFDIFTPELFLSIAALLGSTGVLLMGGAFAYKVARPTADERLLAMAEQRMERSDEAIAAALGAVKRPNICVGAWKCPESEQQQSTTVVQEAQTPDNRPAGFQSQTGAYLESHQRVNDDFDSVGASVALARAPVATLSLQPTPDQQADQLIAEWVANGSGAQAIQDFLYQARAGQIVFPAHYPPMDAFVRAHVRRFGA